MKKLVNRKVKNNKLMKKFHNERVLKIVNCPDLMLWEFVKKTAYNYPNSIAYEYYGNMVSFRRFMYEIEETARSLKSIGVSEGDIVTICSTNIPQAIVSFYAINMIGAISNIIDPFSDEKKIENYLNMTKSKYILTIDLAMKKIINVLTNISIEKIVVMDVADKMNRFTKMIYHFLFGKNKILNNKEIILTWNTFINRGYMFSGNYINYKSIEDIAVILNSEDNGEYQEIMLSNKCFNYATMQLAEVLKSIKVDDCVLSILPMFHILGLSTSIHLPLCLGVRCILVPIFDSNKLGRLIKQYKPNFIVSCSTLIESVFVDDSLEQFDLSFVKEVIINEGSSNSNLKREIDDFMRKHNSNATLSFAYVFTEKDYIGSKNKNVSFKNMRYF